MRLSQVREADFFRRWDVPTLLCFFAIYIAWGSTYLAIRVAVATVPPVFAAGLRFLIAGTILYLFSRARGKPSPSGSEWRNISILGMLMFLISYSALFWAETRISSGIASVLVATIPIWTVLLEVFVLRRDRWHWFLLPALGMGIGGVALLALNSGSGQLNFLPCLAILGGSISWSVGTVCSKEMALPESKAICAAGEMMTGGAMLLLLALILGELPPWPHIPFRAFLAISYLIVAGSLVAFTAYVWLLGKFPATTIASYAYVNPLVALALGHWLGKEAFGLPGLIGALLILGSVYLILKKRTAHHSNAAVTHSADRD